MEGLMINYNNFRDTPFSAQTGNISSSAEFTATLTPGYRVKMISNAAFNFKLSNTAGDTVDYTITGDTTYVPANTYFEFEVHMYRKYFYCKAAASSSNVFVNLSYINGFVNNV